MGLVHPWDHRGRWVLNGGSPNDRLLYQLPSCLGPLHPAQVELAIAVRLEKGIPRGGHSIELTGDEALEAPRHHGYVSIYAVRKPPP